MKNRPVTLAQVLPPHAARLLNQAAQTLIPEKDPLAKVKAIDQVTEWIKRQYPNFFK